MNEELQSHWSEHQLNFTRVTPSELKVKTLKPFIYPATYKHGTRCVSTNQSIGFVAHFNFKLHMNIAHMLQNLFIRFWISIGKSAVKNPGNTYGNCFSS